MELSLCNRLELADVMTELASSRPVFHSEADFQFAFAQTVTSLDSRIRVRLEVPFRSSQTGRAEYVDIVCSAESTTRIELKYPTRKWEGTDGITDERFMLRDHAAMDLARHAFIHDVFRLERLTTDNTSNGLAIMLSNNPNLWEPATRPSRDSAFRIDEGRMLSGNLAWGSPQSPYPQNDRELAGRYVAHWNDFSELAGCRLRWLGWAISSAPR